MHTFEESGKLIDLLRLFFEHKQPDIPDLKEAVTQFSAKIAELAGGVNKILSDERKRKPTFRENFQSFAELCRQSMNPISLDAAIQNLTVQHLLTERIFRKASTTTSFSSATSSPLESSRSLVEAQR